VSIVCDCDNLTADYSSMRINSGTTDDEKAKAIANLLNIADPKYFNYFYGKEVANIAINRQGMVKSTTIDQVNYR